MMGPMNQSTLPSAPDEGLCDDHLPAAQHAAPAAVGGEAGGGDLGKVPPVRAP